MRMRFSQDLYEKMSRRQSFTDENFTTNEELRALALEQAADPKYGGHFANFKCSDSWIIRFRKDFVFQRNCEHPSLSVADKQCILHYADKHPDSTLREIALYFSDNFGQKIDHTMVDEIIRQNIDFKQSQLKTFESDCSSKGKLIPKANFYQELFEEASRRQSTTSEDVYSDKNLRALAFELARQPKYKENMRNFKCSRGSLTRFRKKFHIVSQRKNQWNS